MAWSSFSLVHSALMYFEVESHYPSSWKRTVAFIFHSLPCTFLMLFPEYCLNIVYCRLNTQRITPSTLSMPQAHVDFWANASALRVSEAEALLLKSPKNLSILCKLIQTRIKFPVLISFTHPSSVHLNCIKLPPEESSILMNFRYMQGYSRKTTHGKPLTERHVFLLFV